MPLLKTLENQLLDEYQRWPLWIPVFVGSGIAIYFGLNEEPPFWIIALPCFFLAYLFLASFIFKMSRVLLKLSLWAALFLSLGFSSALLRTHMADTQFLKKPLWPRDITGAIELIEVKPTKGPNPILRLTLSGITADTDRFVPDRARLTIRGKSPELHPGMRIKVKAKLMPLREPTHLNGYDFRRASYFKGIGATGFNFGPVEILDTVPETSFQVQLERFRNSFTNHIRESLPPPRGAVAAALITGDRSSIPDQVREMFISSGLAHILAISGLHLSIVAGLVFVAIRRGGALIPPLARRYDLKKIAAVMTIFVTGLYLCISGFGIPAQRSFIMTSLIMVAILIHRKALSLRTVALAATIIILIWPEMLLTPSFQLSFSAVIALIAAYEVWKNPLQTWLGQGGWWRWSIVYFGGVGFTSLIATLATLPFTIMIFNRYTIHAILANIAAVPLTAVAVMPLALVFCLLTPFGLEGWVTPLFDISLQLLIGIADYVSSLPGADIRVATPPVYVFVMMVMGALWLCLWRKPWRVWGVAPITAAFLILFLNPHTPLLFIDGNAKMVALYDDKGVFWTTSKRRGKFTRDAWMHSLGIDDFQIMDCKDDVCRGSVEGRDVVVAFKALDTVPDVPTLISFEELPTPCAPDQRCMVIKDYTTHTLNLQDGTEIKSPSKRRWDAKPYEVRSTSKRKWDEKVYEVKHQNK